MDIDELFKAMQEGFSKIEKGQTEIKTDLQEVKQRLGKVEIIQEDMQKDIKAILEGQDAHKEQSDRAFKNTDGLLEERADLIETAVKSVSKDIKDIKESIEVLEEMTGKHEVKIKILERRPV